PAVGSMALSMGGAILLAGIFEASGAIIAGGDVVQTVKKGIIDTNAIENDQVYVWVMMAALLGAAIWLNIATALGAPVSTTHSIVGGVMGAGIAAQGWGLVNWNSMGAIASSWVISPLLGGLIAAGLLYTIKKRVYFQDNMLEAAARVVPLFIGLMAWAFTTYLVLKGFKHIIKLPFWQALIIGLFAAGAVVAWIRPRITKRLLGLENTPDSVNQLFTVPLIFAAALLSFAHGANDVANAVGPLAGIYDALSSHTVSGKVAIPAWIMISGALGIALGLALYGPKLIRTVGSEITELDRSRAFCIALSAAITVIIASQLGLPVSSTHVALGAVFGVGFLREYLDNRLGATIETIINQHEGPGGLALETTLHQFYDASAEDKKKVLKQLKQMRKDGELSKPESKELRRLFRRKLVKRQAFSKIIAAWLITVPISACMSALFFFALRGALLP
ncbi:MAG: inorganic phosphate transporter, partial [Oceanococcus sp.]